MIITSIFTCCTKKNEPEPLKISSTTNYIPLAIGGKYTFKRNFISTLDSTINNSDTIVSVIEKDTSYLQKNYFKFKVDDKFEKIVSLIRKVGNNYYAIIEQNNFYDSTECLIMKDNVTIGETWSNFTKGNVLLNTYKVADIKKNINLNGINYSQVAIVVKYMYPENQSYKSSTRYYASGIGEIYSYLSYPESRFFSNIDYSLIKNN